MKKLTFLFLIIPFFGFSQISTKLKLRQLEQGIEGQVIVADSLGVAKWGQTGNGIYGGSDTVPILTYAHTITGPLDDGDLAFAIGDFPSFPIWKTNPTESGIWWNFDQGFGPMLSYGNDYGDEEISVLTENYENQISNSAYYQLRPSINSTRRQNTSSVTNNFMVRSANYGTGSFSKGYIADYIIKQGRSAAGVFLGQYPQFGGVSNSGTGMVFSNTDTSFMFRIVMSKTVSSSSASSMRDVFSIKLEDSTSHNIKLYGYKYAFPNAQPSRTADNKSVMTWTGVGGTSTTPAFTRFSNNVATGSTDGSGDLTITHLLPDATFSVTVTAEGTTPYALSVHTKGASTFKVRVYNPTTGAAVTDTSVTLNWIAYDY